MMALTGLEPLLVKMLHQACVGYSIWPSRLSSRNGSNKRESEIGKGSKQDCN